MQPLGLTVFEKIALLDFLEFGLARTRVSPASWLRSMHRRCTRRRR